MMNGMKYGLLGLMLATLLSACSGMQFGYRFLDNAIRWKLDGYVTNASLIINSSPSIF